MQRKADEMARHRQARNIIEDNRMRVALESQLVANYDKLDEDYREQIKSVI